MDDRTHPSRDNSESRSAPSAPRKEEGSRNGRPGDSNERSASDWSSTSKPALTDRERSERWPVD